MSIISHYIISSYNIWIIKKEDCSFITSHVSMTKDMLVQNANVHALCEETWFQKSRICFRVPSNSIGKIWFQSVGLGEKWFSIPISFALIFFGQKKGGGDRKPIRFSSRLIFPSLRAGASENSPPKIKPFPLRGTGRERSSFPAPWFRKCFKGDNRLYHIPRMLTRSEASNVLRCFFLMLKNWEKVERCWCCKQDETDNATFRYVDCIP